MLSESNSGVIGRTTAKFPDKFPDKFHSRRARIFAPVIVAAIGSTGLWMHGAQAASGVYSNNATSGGLWGTTTNWAGGVVASGSGSLATFNTPGVANTVNLETSYILGGINFNNSSLSWTIANNGSAGNLLTLAGGTVPTINIASAVTDSISASLGGTQGFNVSGAGNLALSGTASTISGVVNITKPTASGGSFQILNSGALGNISAINIVNGATAGSTTMNTVLNGGVTVGNVPLSINMSGGGRGEFDSNGTGTATYNGSISITNSGAQNYQFMLNGSNLVLNGNVNVTNYTNTNFQLRATATGGANVQTFNGNLTLPAGVTLLMNQNGGFNFVEVLNGTANSFTLFGGTYGTFKTGVSGALPAASVYSDATAATTFNNLDLFGTNQTITGLNVTQNGNCTIGSSSNTSASVLTLNNSTGTAYNYRGTIIDSVTTTGLTGTKTVALALLQGTQTLSGADTFSGGTTITGGMLNLNSSTALGTGSVTVTGPGSFNNVSGVYSTVRNLTLNGATITANSGLNSSSNGAYGLLGTVTVGGTAASSFLSASGASNNYIQIGNTSTGSTTTFNVGSTGAVGGDLIVNVPIANYQSGTGFTSVANLTKTGPGVMLVNSPNTYTGATNISGGTFQLGASASINNSPTLIVGAGAIFDASLPGGFTTSSSQSLLRGLGTIKGVVTHNAGLLTPGGVGGLGGTLTFTNGLTLNGGSLQFDLGATSGLATNDQINVVASGGLNDAAGTTPLSIQFSSLPTGTVAYPLFTYTGALNGSWSTSNFAFTTNAGRDALTIDTSTAGVVNLVVIPSPTQNLVWNSTSSNSWDIQTNKNWNNTSTPALNPDYFYNGDSVAFNDGSGLVTAITLATPVQPAAMSINSNTLNYTFSGSGGITGTTGLNMTGTSTLTLQTSNSYTGPTNISAGTVDVGGSSSVGSLGTGPVLNNASLIFSRSDGTNAIPVAVPNTITGTGALNFTGSGFTSLNGPVTQATVGVNSSSGALTLAGGLNSSGGVVITNGTLFASGGYNGTGGITVNGGLAVVSGVNTYTGLVTLNNSGLFYAQSASAFGAGTGPVTVNNGAGIYFLGGNVNYGTLPMTISGSGPATAGALHTGGNAVATYGGTVTAVADSQISLDASSSLVLTNASALSSATNANVTLNGGGSTIVQGNINLGTGSVVNSLTGNLVFTVANNPVINIYSPISGAGNIVVNGFNGSSGQVNFLVDNTFTGNVTVNSGVLAISTPNGLGTNGSSTSGLTTIAGGAPVLSEILLTGNISVGEYFNLGGRQPGTTDPQIRSIGNNTLTGTLAQAVGGNQYTLQSDSGLLNLASGFNLTVGGIRFLNLQGAGDGLVSGVLTNAASNFATVAKFGTGTWTLGVSNGYAGPTNISAGTLAIAAPGALPNFTAVNLTGGTLRANISSGTKNNLFVSSLSLAGSTGAWVGTVDLNNNDMIVQNGNLTTITDQVKQGYSQGAWNGSGGIRSATAAADTTHLTTVGAILNTADGTNKLYASFDGASASAITDVLVKVTYFGDANLDGRVDGSDYSLIDSAYLAEQTTSTNVTGWYNGDFNYDGVVNGSDYTLIDNAYNTQGAQIASRIASQIASPSAQLGGGATSAVPEPASLGLLGLGAIGLLGRRNRRTR